MKMQMQLLGFLPWDDEPTASFRVVFEDRGIWCPRNVLVVADDFCLIYLDDVQKHVVCLFLQHQSSIVVVIFTSVKQLDVLNQGKYKVQIDSCFVHVFDLAS